MSNGEVCCILGVCCDRATRQEKLTEALRRDGVGLHSHAPDVAAWLDERFDFAPKGTLDPLIQAIAEQARAHPKG